MRTGHPPKKIVQNLCAGHSRAEIVRNLCGGAPAQFAQNIGVGLSRMRVHKFSEIFAKF